MKDTNEDDFDDLLRIYLAIVKVVTLCIFISVAVLIPAKYLHIDILLSLALAVFFAADFVCLSTSVYVMYQLSKTD